MTQELKNYEHYINDFNRLRSKEFFCNQNYEVFGIEFQQILKMHNYRYITFKEMLQGCDNLDDYLYEIREFIRDIFDI